jgi:hypothetical protein
MLFLVLYVLLFPAPTGTEFMVSARWALQPAQRPIAAENAQSTGDLSEPAVPYRAGSIYGYASARGDILYQGVSLARVVLEPERLIVFGDQSGSTVVQSPRGELLSVVEQPGYPVLTPYGVAVIGPDGTTLTAVEESGQQLWQVVLPSAITAIDASQSLTVIGLAGGGVRAIRTDGSLLEIDAVSVGLSGVTQVVAVRADGLAFAVVSGADLVVTERQARSMFVTLYEVQDSNAVPVLRREFARDPVRVPELVIASDGSRLLFTEQRGEMSYLGNVDLLSGDDNSLSIEFPPIHLLGNDDGMLWVLGRATRPDPALGFRHPASLDIVSPGGTRVISSAFAADQLSMERSGSIMTFTLDERILALTVERR